MPKASSNLSSKTQTPANDSFSNLVSFSSGPANKNLSLQEQQQKLLEQKAQQQAAQQKRLDSQFTGGDEHFWKNLGSGRSTPAPHLPASVLSSARLPIYSQESTQNGRENGGLSQLSTEDEDDILAAFRADAPVDSSSHFPKPFEQSSLQNDSGQQYTSSLPVIGGGNKRSTPDDLSVYDDDDPFGLAELSKKHSTKQPETRPQGDEDDVLGLLGMPVSELPKPQDVVDPSPPPIERMAAHPQDQAMAELMEMGFSAERAKEALESTESGTDVQQAVGWLLNKAHSESRGKDRARRSSNEGPRQSRDPRIDRNTGSSPNLRQRGSSNQAWSKGRSPQDSQRQASPTSTNSLERDPAQIASEFGTAFLKTAGSLWKTSTKKVQQAVQEFNSDSESSQPKWMREPKSSGAGHRSGDHDGEGVLGRPHRRSSGSKKLESATDEALMLESDRPRAPPPKPPRRPEPSVDSSADNSRDHSPAMPSRLRQEIPVQPAYLRQQQFKPQPRVDNKTALNRQAIDDEASQAYTSSARRRKAMKVPVSAAEPDLLESTPPPTIFPSTSPARTRSLQYGRLAQLPERTTVHSPASPRNIPTLSSISLKASHADREAGNQHFKRGDYSAAHQSYTASLKHLPTNHPLTIVLHTNRALTALKIGEPKTAILDSDVAIGIIGPSKGEGETIDFSNGEPPKPMREYLGKALMRKAEALEQMEKWKEAGAVWKEAVEGGHGGATSNQGRLRCEKAAAPQQPKRVKAPSATSSITRTPVRSAFADLNGTVSHIPSSAAVNRLRSANAAADREDDEKFALADTVDAKLTTWRGGKADNLRALLGSLDTVLWPEAGWKKIGMAELVLPTKVKVQYMKGIAKVHPDKVRDPLHPTTCHHKLMIKQLPTTATTEQRMIAAAVFSTLNEAWDKFKAENGL